MNRTAHSLYSCVSGFRAFKSIGFGLSGGSQPSLQALKDIRSGVAAKAATMIDLDVREEPHFFIDEKNTVTIEVTPATDAAWYHLSYEKLIPIENSEMAKLPNPIQPLEVRTKNDGVVHYTALIKHTLLPPYCRRTCPELTIQKMKRPIRCRLRLAAMNPPLVPPLELRRAVSLLRTERRPK